MARRGPSIDLSLLVESSPMDSVVPMTIERLGRTILPNRVRQTVDCLSENIPITFLGDKRCVGWVVLEPWDLKGNYLVNALNTLRSSHNFDVFEKRSRVRAINDRFFKLRIDEFGRFTLDDGVFGHIFPNLPEKAVVHIFAERDRLDFMSDSFRNQVRQDWRTFMEQDRAWSTRDVDDWGDQESSVESLSSEDPALPIRLKPDPKMGAQ
jgi:hypothetical protein